MSNRYVKTLESYIIPEPVEEGFLAVTGGIIAGITLLSLVTNGISKFKLRGKIKGNSGNPADYGSDICRILQNYSHDIMGVIEPINKYKYLTSYKKLIPILNEAEKIRTQFCSIGFDDPIANKKYEAITKRIEILEKKARAIYNEMENIDLSILATEQVPLNATIIKNLRDIEFNIQNVAWSGGHDGGSLIMTEDFYFSELSHDLFDDPEASQCIEAFDNLMDYLTYEEESYDTKDICINYIKKCKFAINPNSKLKRSK